MKKSNSNKALTNIVESTKKDAKIMAAGVKFMIMLAKDIGDTPIVVGDVQNDGELYVFYAHKLTDEEKAEFHKNKKEPEYKGSYK
jgi:hypothetical protein